VIGDPALRLEGRFEHVLDLGQAWLEWTGLPFLFAAWGALPGAKRLRADQDALRAALAEGLRGKSVDRARPRRNRRRRRDHGPRLPDRIGALRVRRRRAARARALHELAGQAGLLPKTTVRFADDPEPPRPSSIDAPRPARRRRRAAFGERRDTLATEASLFDVGAAADEVRRASIRTAS